MNYSESVGDLFEVPNDYVLAHCISADCKMGAGIAVVFNKEYRHIQQYCLSQNPNVGDVILFKHRKHHVFNLITKSKYYGKPTYQILRSSLENMKAQVIECGYKKIAMPLIGCGLDKLSWGQVRLIVQEVFGDLDVEILVVKKQ